MPPFLRETALQAYLQVTWRHRQSLTRRFSARKSFPGAILFYHRVADHSPNHWSITNKNFLRHLDWLQQHFEFVSLDDTVAAQKLGERERPSVHITFDDGYAENMSFALPELIRRGIPTTYFVTTRFVEEQIPFPHDVANGCPLSTNTIDDIRCLADAGVVIGAHSQTHIDFGQPLSPTVLRAEIVDVRKKLQDWTGQSIDYFAFPFGLPSNIVQSAIDVVFEAGYKAFVSAAGGFNFPGDDHRHLQRIHADPGMAALINWLTFDPRKTMRPSPICYTFSEPISDPPPNPEIVSR
ncbi:MAG: polysaccharide deacetylase family protein [Planctomycetota bacterium]|jgi:peptidoglycan/xylan/chitin deacetylase (PgdA/CDA1 family)